MYSQYLNVSFGGSPSMHLPTGKNCHCSAISWSNVKLGTVLNFETLYFPLLRFILLYECSHKSYTGIQAVYSLEGCKVWYKIMSFVYWIPLYCGNTTDVASSVVPTDGLKACMIVAKLAEPLFSQGHTIWMDNYCIS
jgi:hypothetical protein